MCTTCEIEEIININTLESVRKEIAIPCVTRLKGASALSKQRCKSVRA